jgi:hypothetical protein
VACGDHDGLSVSDRDYSRVLLPSGTQRARSRFGRSARLVRPVGSPQATD